MFVVKFVRAGQEKKVRRVSIKPAVTVGNANYNYFMPWGDKSKRDRRGLKFIANPGDYVDRNGSQNTHDEDLRLWCDAEWISLFRKIGNGLSYLPDFEHVVRNVPAVVRNVPAEYRKPPKPQDRLVTESYVFGSAFRLLCDRMIHKNLSPWLSDGILPLGSIILIGSQTRINGGFWLDTVFVVDKKFIFVTDEQGKIWARLGKAVIDVRELPERFPEYFDAPFIDRVLNPTLEKHGMPPLSLQSTGIATTKKNIGLVPGLPLFTIYIGKVFDPQNPKDPFSFVPVLPNGWGGYLRPLLTKPISVCVTEVFSPVKRQDNLEDEPDLEDKEIGYFWTELGEAIRECAFSIHKCADYKYAWHIDN